MNKDYTVQGTVHGVGFISRTDSGRFHEYVRKSYDFFLQDATWPGNSWLIDSTLLLEAQVDVPDLSGFSRLGYGLFCGRDSLYYEKDGLRVVAEIHQARRCVEIRASFRLKPLVRLCKLMACIYRTPDYIRTYRFLELLRHHLHFPLFWILEREKGIHVMHGAAFLRGKEKIVWVGMNGVGKSTALLQEMSDPDARFLSDNYVLFDANAVYAFPDTVRLAGQAVGQATDAKPLDGWLRPTGLRFGKRDVFRVDRGRVEEKFAPTKIAYLANGREAAEREISPEQMEERICITNEYVGELHSCTFWECLHFLNEKAVGLQAGKLSALESLTRKTKTVLKTVPSASA